MRVGDLRGYPAGWRFIRKCIVLLKLGPESGE